MISYCLFACTFIKVYTFHGRRNRGGHGGNSSVDIGNDRYTNVQCVSF